MNTLARVRAANYRLPESITSPKFSLFEPCETPRETFESILANVKIQRGNGRETMIRKAFELASEVHKGQKRKDPGVPEEQKRDYIIHPLAVFHYVTVLGGSHLPACVGLLHDTIEESRKRRLSVNFSYLSRVFAELGDKEEIIATDVAYVSNPICAGPSISTRKNGAKYIWIPATNLSYDTTRDFFRDNEIISEKERNYQPEVYLQMREFYFNLLVTRIGAFIVKLCDVIDNLSDISNLPSEKRQRKLNEDRVLINIAARMDWTLYELMAYFLRQNDITVPDLAGQIIRQQRKGVVICRPRSKLDFTMASRELPIQHPSSAVVTAYMSRTDISNNDFMEVGLPRIEGVSKIELLNRYCEGLGLSFVPGTSLFRGYFDLLGAKDTIYVVNGLRQSTVKSTSRRIDLFLERLRRLQSELTQGSDNSHGNGRSD